jgi:ribosome-associated toxin RatA of RatAB toxin-antitoxin module
LGKLEPQDLEFADAAPFKADATTVCPVSAGAVFDVMRDHRRWPEWVGAGVTSVVPTSDPDYGIGSTRTVTFWRFAQVQERFIGWEEPTLWAFTGTSFRPRIFSKLVERFQIEPIDDQSCRIVYRMAADFPLLLRPFGGIVIGFMAWAAKPSLERMSQEAVRRQG